MGNSVGEVVSKEDLVTALIAKIPNFGKILNPFNEFRAVPDSSSFSEFTRFQVKLKDNQMFIGASDGYFLARGAYPANVIEEKVFEIEPTEKLTKKMCSKELSEEIYFEETHEFTNDISSSKKSIGKLYSGNKEFIVYPTNSKILDFRLNETQYSVLLQDMYDKLIEAFDEKEINTSRFYNSKREDVVENEEIFYKKNFYVEFSKEGILIKDVLSGKTLYTQAATIESKVDKDRFHINKRMFYKTIKLFKENNINEIIFEVNIVKKNIGTGRLFSLHGGNLYCSIAGLLE